MKNISSRSIQAVLVTDFRDCYGDGFYIAQTVQADYEYGMYVLIETIDGQTTLLYESKFYRKCMACLDKLIEDYDNNR